MAPHPSALAWRLPWTEEPGGLQSVGSLGRTRLKRLSSQGPDLRVVQSQAAPASPLKRGGGVLPLDKVRGCLLQQAGWTRATGSSYRKVPRV